MRSRELIEQAVEDVAKLLDKRSAAALGDPGQIMVFQVASMIPMFQIEIELLLDIRDECLRSRSKK